MKEIKLVISKTEVLKSVSLNSEYTGAGAFVDVTLYDRVTTAEVDEALLHRFWLEMAGEVMEKLQPFIVNSSLDDNGLTLTLEVSGSYEDSFTPSVLTDLAAAFSAGISGRWFRLTCADQSLEWIQQSFNLLDRVVSKLCFRRRPVRE